MQAGAAKSPDGDALYLPISAVAELLYCPRNFYYRVAEGAQDQNRHVVQGKLEEERRDERATLSRGEVRQRRGVMISSERLHLIGVVDVLEEAEDLYPVEYKKGEGGGKPQDHVQLCAQAMVLEDVTGRPIPRGYLYYGESHAREEVIFTDDLRAQVQHAIDRAFQILADGVIPEAVHDARCQGCSLQARCMPAEVTYLKGQAAQPERVLAGVNLGRVLYVEEPGAYVRKTGERLQVTKDQAVLKDVPAVNIDEVVLVGQVNLSTAAARLLLESDIPVAFVSAYGEYEGALQPAYSKAAPVRIAQVQRHLDARFGLMLAKEFVTGKLTNMRTLLMRYRRNLPDAAESLEAAIGGIAEILQRVGEVADAGSLLGLEGAGSRYYFQVFGQLIKPGLPFAFERRTRRPPEDPVNALLGFAYALLCKELVSAAALAHLDPYVGYLHTPKYGRPALALDLMEEFRPIVADSVVLSLLNTGAVTQEDFEPRFQGCYLTAAGRKKFYRAWEQRKGDELTHPVFGYKVSYRRAFEVQARLLAKVIQGDVPRYQPLVVR